MKSSVLFGCCIVFFLMSSVSFAGDYRFSSKLNFEYDDGFFPGILDQYVLKEDPSIRLLIGYFENRDFQTELRGLLDDEIKNKFVAKNRELDFSGVPENRKVIDYSVNREGAEIFIFLKYEIKSDNGAAFEINSFRVRGSEAIAATLYYDQHSTSDVSREIHRMMNMITFRDSQETAGLDDTEISRKPGYRSLPSLLASEILPKALAADCSIVDKKYVLKGNYSTTAGSAIFNFKQLSMDVVAAVQQNDPNSDCLATSMNSALTNASDYWARRGLAEGCLTSDGGVPESAPDGCPDASFKEMKRSFAYIDKIKTDLSTSLDKMCLSDASGTQCQQPSNRATVDAAAGVLAATANLQHRYCCDPGKNGDDLGPLMKVLNSDDKNFKNFSDSEKVKQCIRKTQGSLDKKMSSLGGVGDCLNGVVSSLVNSLYSMIKGMVSLFDWETVKLVTNLVNIFNSDARNGAWGKVSSAVKELGQLIAAQISSVTDCLGPYEKEQYICKMTGSALGALLAPSTINLLVKTIVSAVKLGGKATGLTTLLTAAAQKPPLKNTIAISQQSVQTLKREFTRATSAVTNTVGLKAIQKGARRVISILPTHFNKPFAMIVAQSARRMLDTAANRAKAGATKVNQAVSGAAEKVRTGLSVRNIAGEIPHAESVVAPVVVRSTSAPIGRGTPVSDMVVAKHKATIVEFENKQAQIIANGNLAELRESLSNLRTSRKALYRAGAGAVDGSGKAAIKATLDKAIKTEFVLQKKIESLRDRPIDLKRTRPDPKTEYAEIRSRGAPGSVRGPVERATAPAPEGLKPSLLETKNYVRETTDPIRSQNYINNAIESAENFQGFWVRTNEMTGEGLRKASEKMHKIAGLGADGRTPYNGAANNKNINYGVVRNYNMMNERGANMYAREISKKYGLGPIIEDGGVPLEGISKASRPWNEGPAHYYPDGKNMQEYFDQGANHLNQLKTKAPGSAEAMDAIADYYQVMANARPFDNINNSLFMTQTNTLLSEFKFSPMTHGYLDHLAQRLTPEQFRKVFKIHNQEGLALPSPYIKQDLL